MQHPVVTATSGLFLGQAPQWYKLTIVGFLVINPAALAVFGPFVAGWLILLEFIFALALALKCYPLQSGGLLALEAVALGLATPQAVYRETAANFPVILLLMFMVAGIYFLRELLAFVFTKLFLKVRNKTALSLLFCFAGALLSAFLDALTVVAVIISVAAGLYEIYHKATSVPAAPAVDGDDTQRLELDKFRAFLRSVVMHAAIGTALGGVSTLVGEPQNLLIGTVMGWDFGAFFRHVAPVSMPVLAVGLVTCFLVERFRAFGFGETLPPSVHRAIAAFGHAGSDADRIERTVRLWVQGIAALLLVAGLSLHVAEVGLIGLAVIIVATAFCGIIDERRLGHSFEEALPFTALLVTFFAVIAVVHQQGLFAPVIEFVLEHDGPQQVTLMYVASGLLSAISDNVFVATIYISSVKEAFDAGAFDQRQFELLAVAINTGTNIPSVATPNGQAAFLFLLTSAIAPLIRLGYMQILWMAFPYTVTMSVSGYLATRYLLE